MAAHLDSLLLEQNSTRARAACDLFTLPLKDRNWRGNPGDFAGSGVGSSLDFQDHRTYLPGDDPRHINWQAFARTGDYTLKLYREEVRPVIELVLDASGSMFTDPEKASRVLETFYFCFFAAERAGASAKIFAIKGDQWKSIEFSAMVTHSWRSEVNAIDQSSPSASPRLTTIPFRPRSLRILISDGLYPSSPESIIRALQHNSGRAIVLCPYCQAESDPGWDGNYEFVDTEGERRHDRRVDPGLLRRYLATYRSHFASWKAAAIRAQAPFARLPASGTFSESIHHEAISSGAIQLA